MTNAMKVFVFYGFCLVLHTRAQFIPDILYKASYEADTNGLVYDQDRHM